MGHRNFGAPARTAGVSTGQAAVDKVQFSVKMNACFVLVCVAALVVVYASPIDKLKHGVRAKAKEHKFNKAQVMDEDSLSRGRAAKISKGPTGRGRVPEKVAKAVLDSEAHVDKVAKAVPEGRPLNKVAKAPQHHIGRNAHRAQKAFKSVKHHGHQRQDTVISCPTSGVQVVDAPVTISVTDYENHQNCEWLVTVPEGRYINVAFTRMSIEDHINCARDSLTIYDSDEHRPALAVLCGSVTPAMIQSVTNQVFIRFSSDYSVTAGGFEMVITATDTQGAVSDSMLASMQACPGPLELTGTELIIQSPGFDVQQPYTNNLQCHWTVSVTRGMFARLEFLSMQVEASTGCWFDEVLVLDGANQSQLGSFCGSDLPEAVTGSSNSLEVIFYTDYSVTGAGFSIRVTETDVPASEPEVHSACPGPLDVSADGSAIVSANFGSGNYNDYETCAWRVSAGPGQYVTLMFSDFDVEYDATCSYDRLTIHEGSDDTAPSVTYCGSDLPPDFTSTGQDVFVTFTSDYCVNAGGFRIYAAPSATPGEILPDNPILSSPGPHHIALTEGDEPTSIYSPLYFTTGYRNDEFSSWLIEAPEGRFIGVHFVSLSVEEGYSECEYDAVTLLDGPNTLHLQQLEVCGQEQPDDFVTQTNIALIEFTSDGSVTYQGFHIQFTVETEPGTLIED